ncbi:MAG: helix-turn-helix transcriptional regulator [Clostridiaceae bacterium]|nr:helix-turn-helix transcriptional regulator [Clostridiaceae bacterium]
MVIGPFRTRNLRHFEASKKLEECYVDPSLLKSYMQYYNSLPYQSEENVRIIAQTTLIALYGDDCNISERNIDMGSHQYDFFLDDTYETLPSVETIESRHNLEDFYLSQITRGNFTAAYSAYQKLSRESSPYGAEMNNEAFTIIRSITRIAARRSGVPAASLHMLTESCKNRVNKARNAPEIETLTKQFISDICAVVRRFSTLAYSQPIRQAIEYIWRNLSIPFTLENLAEEIGLSPAWLSRKFHKETGQTITSFINRERMRSAAEYLAFTDMTIHEISSIVGIPDSNYFTKLFKKVYGIVPKDFRKNPNYAHPLLKTSQYNL